MTQIVTGPITDPKRQAAALALYAEPWPAIPPAIEQARAWGVRWFEHTRPSVIMDGERMIAHVGCTALEWAVNDRPVRVSALHAVCVATEMRGQGLGRAAMEAALAEVDARGEPSVVLWSEKVAFYRRFGFRPLAECAFLCAIETERDTSSRVLNFAQASDRALMRDVFESRRAISSHAAAIDDGWIFLIDLAIHVALGEMNSPLSIHLPAYGALAVGFVENETLVLLDVVARDLPPLPVIAGAFRRHLKTPFNRAQLRFTPDRLLDAATKHTAIAYPSEDQLLIRGAPVFDESQTVFALGQFTRT